MKKFLGLFLAGVLVAPITAARAHDMADMAEMSHPAMQQTAAVAPNTVTIDNFNFGPNMLTVAPGTTVTWVNRDDEPHTVVSADDPKLFRSGALDTGDSFTFTFAKPGTYKYFCSIHPHMTGMVVVK